MPATKEIRVYEPTERYRLDELRDPKVAAEFSTFRELYVSRDAERRIYAAAEETGADFQSELAAHPELADDPIVQAKRFVRCPAPRFATPTLPTDGRSGTRSR